MEQTMNEQQSVSQGEKLVIEYITELMDLTQDDKTIDEYEQEFHRLIQYAPDDYKDNEEKKKQFFMAGLKPRLQRSLIELELPDFATLVEQARSLEGKREEEQHEKKKRIIMEEEKDRLTESPASKKMKYANSSRMEEVVILNKDEPFCWKCKGPHYPRKCPQLQHKCYLCDKKGHMANTCLKRSKLTCFICQKLGHISAYCPQKVQSEDTKSPQFKGLNKAVAQEGDSTVMQYCYIQCWKCGKEHRPKKCPELKDKCSYCGKLGHKVKYCFKRRNAVICNLCGKQGHDVSSCYYK